MGSNNLGYLILLLLLHGCCCFYTVGVDAVDVPPEVDRVCKRADRSYYGGIYDFCVHVLLIHKQTPTANLTMLGFIGLASEFMNVSLTYEFIKTIRDNGTLDETCSSNCLKLYDLIFLAIKYAKEGLSAKDYDKFYYMAAAIDSYIFGCDICFGDPAEQFGPLKERNFHVRGIGYIITAVGSLLLGWP